MAAPTTTYRMWKRLASGSAAPGCFGSRDGASAEFRVDRTACGVRMEPGFAEVAAPKWFFVKVSRQYHERQASSGHNADHVRSLARLARPTCGSP